MAYTHTNATRAARIALALGSAAIASAAQPAFAQDTPQPHVGADEDIVVTARRREEKLQDVPLAITALSSQQLQSQGIDSTRSLSMVTPNVTIGGSGIYTQPRIRGVGTSSLLAGDESNVASYIDGVYVPQMYAGLMKFNDIERVEVLRGPQGTLFGRNATGGALQIITRAPSDVLTGDFSVGYGSFNQRVANARLSGPISDSLSASISAFYDHDDGYVWSIPFNRKVGFDRSEGVRGKVRFRASDNLTILLSGSYLNSDNIASISTQPIDGNASGLATPGVINASAPRTMAQGILPFFNVQTVDASLKIAYDTGSLLFTSLSAYRGDRAHSITDSDLTTANLSLTDNRQPSDLYTQEIQVATTGSGPLQFVAGVFLYKNDTGYDPLTNKLTGSVTQSIINTKSWAVFGEATYEVMPHFFITGGLRYSWEEKHNRGTVNGTLRVDKTQTWDDVTPRAVLKYEVPGLLNLYASYSQGFKSGQFNSGDLSGVTVAPEKVKAYEIGAKTLGPVRATAAAFQYDYTNIQVQQFLPSAGVARIQNAAKAKIKGFELTVDTTIESNLVVGARVSYLDARYQSFNNALSFVRKASGFGNDQTTIIASGNRMPFAPEWTVGVNAAYTVDGVFGGSLTIGSTAYMSSDVYYTVDNKVKQDDYVIVNGNVTWTSADDHVKASAWVNNATNETYALLKNSSQLGNQVAYAKPASVGVRLGYSF